MTRETHNNMTIKLRLTWYRLHRMMLGTGTNYLPPVGHNTLDPHCPYAWADIRGSRDVIHQYATPCEICFPR